MKKSLFVTLTAVATLVLTLTSCKGPKASAQSANDQNKSECSFEFGTDLSAYFSGTTYLNNIVPANDTFAESNVITFAPGAKNKNWHTHGEMYVIGVAGEGIYQEEGKEPIVIHKGDVIHIPAGLPHIHGAAEDSWFQQIVIYDRDWKAE